FLYFPFHCFDVNDVWSFSCFSIVSWLEFQYSQASHPWKVKAFSLEGIYLNKMKNVI
ncbi:hypothetical protein X975_23395, partial [Stegodyphus mimosarum]